jgi:hypothetical protein
MSKSKKALETIDRNIKLHGQHIYVVSGGSKPRYAYTIGNYQSHGSELILAGAILYLKDDLLKILKEIGAKLGSTSDWASSVFDVEDCGSFSLRRVHASWSRELVLGACDFYKQKDIPALQIVPDLTHRTIDIPDMSEPFSASVAGAWKWLNLPWPYKVPANSTIVTNLAALRGERVTEACRWEENEWELFAGNGPETPQEEVRVVPLETLLWNDPSLHVILDLPVGEGLWRDEASDWHIWRGRE